MWLAVSVLTMRTYASHLVGGEFELVYKSGTTYTLSIILYFDELNGSPGAKDLSITASIFRKSDNKLMSNVVLPIITETDVAYTQPACSKGELKTLRIVYRRDVPLKPELFNDPEGYYIAWQRCCRNYTITNIFSQNPETAGAEAAGQTFYMEFPAVVKNGEPFLNSSPRLFQPLSDYACPGRLYYVDFSGVDDDGDSLVYSMVTPLSTKTVDALPPVSPTPYPPVKWRPGFSLTKITGGTPDMNITTNGLLTVKAKNQGLYVFAVRCEEYRNGVKIGEVRRDFQLLVLDVCPVADPPQILGKRKGDTSYGFDGSMSISYAGGAPEDARCISVQVSDPDALKEEDKFRENITIRAIPIGFSSGPLASLLPAETSAVLFNGSTREFEICLPECPLNGKTSYQIGIVAADDACSLPLTDTLKITVQVQIPPNAPPIFSSPDVSEQIQEGQSAVWPIAVTDPDGDPLNLNINTQGFSLANTGMSITYSYLSPSQITGELRWDAACDRYDFSQKTSFNILLRADDDDLCNVQNKNDLMKLDLSIRLPGNASPRIDSDLTPDPDERRVDGINLKLLRDNTLTFQVTGSDLTDNDQLQLKLEGAGFNPADYGISFPGGSGTGSVTSPLTWNLDCRKFNLQQKSIFDLRLLVVDNANKCRVYKADTLNVLVQILKPDNNAPQLSILNLNTAVEQSGPEYRGQIREDFKLKVTATDSDGNPTDRLSLGVPYPSEALPPGYTFTTTAGTGTAEGLFTWSPDCQIFKEGSTSNTYEFSFIVSDDRCNNPLSEALPVRLVISDKPFDESRLRIPNVITPNGDELNDYFALDDTDEALAAAVGFPEDNCFRKFEEIRILNRWGKTVFQSKNRYFRWNADQESEGVYFYTVQFNDYFYKGSVTVVR